MKSKIASFALLVLVAAIARAQDFSQKVTYETVAAPASKVLAELSKSTGVNFSVTPQTANEVLVVGVKDVALADLMAKIAAVTDGEWTKIGDGYRLGADSAARARAAAADHARKLAAIKKKYAELLAVITKTPVLTEKSITEGDGKSGTSSVTVSASSGGSGGLFASGTGGKSPGSRAITRLLSGIDLNAITSLGPKERIVFSTNPTAMQRPLGPGAGDVIDTLVAEQNIYVDATKKAEGTPADPALPDAFKNLLGISDQKITATPAKALLIVSDAQFFGGPQAQLVVYDADGKRLTSASESLAEALDFSAFMPQQAKKGPKDDSDPIVFSETTAELFKLFSGNMMMFTSTSLNMSPELRKRLTHPDEFDPLSFAPSESLLFVGKAKHLQVVASLPDNMVSLLGMMTSSKPTVSTFMNQLKGDKEAVATQDATWLTVKPVTPNQNRDDRFDRKALSTLIAAAAAKGVPSLDDLGAYAMRNNDASINGPSML